VVHRRPGGTTITLAQTETIDHITFSNAKGAGIMDKAQGGDPMKPGDPVVPASLSVLDQVTKPFELKPDAAQERTAATQLIQSHGREAFCRSLLNVNELIDFE
jgi:hypothetical protein